MGVVGYNGGRRGGAEDVIRRPGENQLSATVAAQALAAFHGRPDVAYHAKGQIWETDAIYSEVFPERTNAKHILFAYSLLRAVEQEKLALNAKPEETLTQSDRELSTWFSLRGSTFLAVTAVGAVAETVLGAAVPDRYGLSFKKKLSVAAAIAAWQPVLKAVLALAPTQLSVPLLATGALRNRVAVETATNNFRAVLVATSTINQPIYSAFAQQVAQA